MSDHSTSHATTVRGIDYKATFPFVHLFKGFRLAIDPSKILLALALLLLVYAGGRIMDAFWPDSHRAVQGELDAYAVQHVRVPELRTNRADRTNLEADFETFRRGQVTERVSEIKQRLASLGHPDFEANYGGLKKALRFQRDDTIKRIDKSYDDLTVKTDEAKAAHDASIQSAHANYANEVREAQKLDSEGLFIHFLRFEIDRIDAVVFNAVKLNGEGLTGVLAGLGDFFITAPAWAFRHHTVYFVIFFAGLLILWSIFGGAIARIAAVQVARDEKISVRQALRFSTGKVLSFVFAPLIPIIIVAVLGLIMAVASILISVPGLSGIWSVVIGAIFFLALLAGLVMMLTAVGLIGGGHLMYPTIAAEGSDSFDAVSRSFSYLYARPWQLAFYSLVSLVYGAITYLVVRLALFVLLLLVHGSINLFQWGHAVDGTPIFEAMWPKPTNFMTLSFDTNYASLGAVQATGAGLISFWVYLAISILGAYVISLYLCSGTLIYFLLRRDVDATELDEVYLEPNDDELSEAAVTTEATLASDAAASPVAPAPAEPAGQPVDTPTPPVTNPPWNA
ncbi:MAG: hypothetical protein JWM57_3115 [Phycisphaerales bacterium]|nr:hypothetical protein [Phycisphaerales bacterium]